MTIKSAPSSRGSLLVVEDDESIRELLAAALRFAGFDVAVAADGLAGVLAARAGGIDLILMDVMMPHIDGVEAVAKLRREGVDTPVVFLTARDELPDKIAALDAGGDDYVTKPFSLEEVVARVHAHLRRARTRAASTPRTVLAAGELVMDTSAHQVHFHGCEIDLSPTEWKLLHHLLSNPRIVCSKASILDHVWEYDFGGDGGVVESYISYLRRKLEAAHPGGAELIQTVRGVGYILRVPA